MNLLSKILDYGLMLKQVIPAIDEVAMVSSDDEIINLLRDLKTKKNLLVIVEPEIPTEGTQDADKDLIMMQFIVFQKIADKSSVMEKLQLKDDVLNIIYKIHSQLKLDHAQVSDYAFQFGEEENFRRELPNTDPRCLLIRFLDTKSVQKTPLDNQTPYTGWTLTFNLKFSW